MSGLDGRAALLLAEGHATIRRVKDHTARTHGEDLGAARPDGVEIGGDAAGQGLPARPVIVAPKDRAGVAHSEGGRPPGSDPQAHQVRRGAAVLGGPGHGRHRAACPPVAAACAAPAHAAAAAAAPAEVLAVDVARAEAAEGGGGGHEGGDHGGSTGPGGGGHPSARHHGVHRNSPSMPPHAVAHLHVFAC